MELAKLYATNYRELMNRLISSSVYPDFAVQGPLFPLVIRYACSHTGMKSFRQSRMEMLSSTNKQRLAFEHDHSFFSSIEISMPMQVLRHLSPSLTCLELASTVTSTTGPYSTEETLDSLFPHLKRLSFFDTNRSSSSIDSIYFQLLQKLPQNLDTLILKSAIAAPKLNDLPSSLTALHVTHPTAMARLAGFPASTPAYLLLHRLNAQTPLLKELSFSMVDEMQWGSPLDFPLHITPSTMIQDIISHKNEHATPIATILPHLTCVNISGSKPSPFEVTCILMSLKSVPSLVIAINALNWDDSGNTPVATRSLTPGRTFPPSFTPTLTSSAPSPSATPSAVKLDSHRSPFAYQRHHRLGGIADPIFPSNLTSLKLGGPSTSSTTQLTPHFFKVLAARTRIVSLSLYLCQMDWSLEYTESQDENGSQFEAFIFEANNRGFGGDFGAAINGGFGGVFAAAVNGGFGGGLGGGLGAAPKCGGGGGGGGFSGQHGSQSWLSILSACSTLVEIELSEQVPWRAKYLPPSLTSFNIHCELQAPSSGDDLFSQDTRKLPIPKVPDYVSTLNWPYKLSSLILTTTNRFSKADARSLPSSLTVLKTKITPGWNQEDLNLNLLQRLPNCFIILIASVIWLTDPVQTISILKDHASHVPQYPNLHAPSIPVDASGRIDLLKFVRFLLSDLPRRIHATWRLSVPASEAQKAVNIPIGIPPLHLPRSARYVSFPSDTLLHFEYGILENSHEIVALLTSIQEHLVEVTAPSIATSPWLPLLNVPQLNSFSNLTKLELPLVRFSSLQPFFKSLPRCLTHLKLGTEEVMLTNLQCPAEWMREFRPHVGEMQPAFPNSVASVINLVSLLPRGLIVLDVPIITIPPSDEDWPPALEVLGFRSDDWQDWQVLQLHSKLSSSLKSMIVYGTVSVYGLQPHEKARMEKANYLASKLALDSNLPSEITYLDNIDLLTLFPQLHVPFEVRNIEIKCFFIPSPFVLVSPSTASISLSTFEAPTVLLAEQGRVIHNLAAESPWNISFSDQFCPTKIFPTLHSLTSLTITWIEVQWILLSYLPPNLKHLFLHITEPSSSTQCIIDPFHNCPASMESIRISSLVKVSITSEGFSKLPPKLTRLECNNLSFSPLLIPHVPRRITTLLFNAHGGWSDVDVYALKNHLGSNLDKLSIANCHLSGALLPLHNTTEVTTSSLKEVTNARLGPQVVVTWLCVTGCPFSFCALDLSQNSFDHDMNTFSTSHLVNHSVNAIKSLDLRRCELESLSSAFPHLTLPGHLTSLKIRVDNFTARDASSLPQTLQDLEVQLMGRLVDLEPYMFGFLPRNLASLTIDHVSGFCNSTEKILTTPAISFAEPLHLHRFPRSRLIENAFNAPVAPILPCTVAQLDGLPKNLVSLSLRPFYLFDACFGALGPNLKLLRCADYEREGRIAAVRVMDIEMVDTSYERLLVEFIPVENNLPSKNSTIVSTNSSVGSNVTSYSISRPWYTQKHPYAFPHL